MKMNLLKHSDCDCWRITPTHQVLGIEGDLVPPRRHKLVVAVEDAAVHVLVPPRVKEGLEPTESEEQGHKSRFCSGLTTETEPKIHKTLYQNRRVSTVTELQ